jgi:von Willebrand factor type A domain/Putative Flp pilus-assembly TadE/G-like
MAFDRKSPITSSERGQSLILFTLSLVVMLGFVAMSIDVGRLVWARTSMQSAVDSAALAAAQSLPDTAEAANQAQLYFLDNTSFIQSQGTNVQFSVTYPPGSKSVAVRGDADLPTWFARLFGINSFHVSADGEAESIVIDAVVVLDRSGSMCWDSLGPNGYYRSQVRLRSSINSSQTSFRVIKNDSSRPMTDYMFVGQVFRLESSSSSEWLQVTGLTEPDTVQVIRGVDNPNNGNSSSASSHNSGRRPRGDTCQQAGAGPYLAWEYVKTGARIFTDQMNGDFDRVGYAQFSTAGSLEIGLTNSLTQVKNAIATSPDPTAGGITDRYTNIANGFYQGIYELETNGRNNAKWVIVLLSDGVANRYCSPSESVSCPSQSSGSSTSRSRTLDQADHAISHGITVYTIGYGTDSDDALMQEIANRTGGTFYKVPTEDDLAAAFISIAKATQIRLSK